MSELVHFTEHDTHGLLAMDDGKANALGFDMFEGLNAGLDKVEATGKVALITGRPGKFSAGFDLSVMGKGDESTLKLLREGADLARRLMTFRAPVVLAVSGHALAMGALLCLSADYRIGTLGDYKIGLNETAIGMTLPWFGVELARERLATTHLGHAVNLGKIYDAPGAIEAGFLDDAVNEDALLSVATGAAQALSGLHLPSHGNVKQRVRGDFLARYEDALRRDFESGEIMPS